MPACPTCGSSVDEPVGPGTAVTMPSVPPAFDLASAIASLNMLIVGYNNMRGPAGAPGKNGKSKTAKGGKYVELKQKRVTNTVKVASKQDPDTYVEFKRIDALTFHDTKTNEIWTWQRGHDK